MQACYIERYGDADVVRVGELPAPEPGPGELVFRMQAASVNPVDNKRRAPACCGHCSPTACRRSSATMRPVSSHRTCSIYIILI